MGRTKPRTISELMDVANRFADGEDAYHNKRARSPKDDRPHRYNSQRRRSRNYDNHNQIATGFKGRGSEGEERQSIGYHNRDDSGSNKQFRPRNYDSSPKEILNGPCHMHYAYVDEKRVSNHLMGDFRTFLRLQEAVGLKQADAQGSIAYDTPPPPLPNHGETATQGQFKRVAKAPRIHRVKKTHSRNDLASAKVEKGAAKHIQKSQSSHNIASSHYRISGPIRQLDSAESTTREKCPSQDTHPWC
jgi:hypothetical protein